MMDCQPAHDGVERSVRQRMAEGIAAEMRYALAKAAASCQIDANRIQIRLQFKRGDLATGGVRKKAGRAAYTRADVEHLARVIDPKLFSRGPYCIDTVIVPLV
jgi:hypothetical protein